jgi:hypothetical protein
MCHPFRNDASHMNLLSGEYFGYVLSDVCLCVSFIHDFSSVTLLFSNTPVLGI